jgi:hypothetical protein
MDAVTVRGIAIGVAVAMLLVSLYFQCQAWKFMRQSEKLRKRSAFFYEVSNALRRGAAIEYLDSTDITKAQQMKIDGVVMEVPQG